VDVTATILRGLYSLLFYLSLPLLLLRLWWRGRQHPGYRQRIGERFGFIDATRTPEPSIWIHAVSFGEVQAAVPIIEELIRSRPSCRLLLSTTTPTGSEHARRLFGDRVSHCYFPFDTPTATARFLDRIRPVALLLMETELWPNLLHACQQRRIPALLLNARMSARSHHRYARARPLVAVMLRQISAIAAQSQPDAKRLVDLGAPASVVQVTGSIKFDLALPVDLDEQLAARRVACASPRPIWIAASTHAGEEPIMLAAHLQLLRTQPQALLLLAPRHPARATEVMALIEASGLTVRQRSRGESCDASTKVYMIDTLGELLPFYATADIAFVGGSMVPVGGHNMLEPAAVGVPVLHGPFVFNFDRVARLLGDAGAATCTNGADGLIGELERLFDDPALRARRGEAGRSVVRDHAGATARVMKLILTMVDA
jgi:3-deoxy-D-manno-octulosonic-acid transferase